MTLRLIAVLVFAVALARCGVGDEEAAPRSDSTAASDHPAGSTAAPDPSSSGCVTSVEVTEMASGAVTTLTEAGAVSLGGGSAYTMYAADFPLDMSAASLAFKPDVPADGHLATVAVTVFQPEQTPTSIEAGTVVPAGTELGELVFVATYATGADRYGNNTGISGSLTMREVGTAICVEIDYSDEEKAISGIVASDAVAVS